MTWTNPTTLARIDLGNVLALALSHAEEFMREAEAHHKAIGGDVLNPNGADQRASLSECLLSHRVVCMLRQLAEMLPATPDETPVVVPTAHRVVHPPAPGWSRAPEEVIGSTVGSLARALYSLSGCKHFDLHVAEAGGDLWRVWVDPEATVAGSYHAVAVVFGEHATPGKFMVRSL